MKRNAHRVAACSEEEMGWAAAIVAVTGSTSGAGCGTVA
ncbi:hypothetical protein NSPZN2_10690 [Nitrospira defluvii]|uniref:Uncharacterized protein n=1 Tax=Nitrospira defluvii TaxID=330214 RepID=A0ABM8QJ96_9BACT|nr:hypothetical protein NSPZN2_10690 [Nitrospira defluvii]